MSDTLPEIVNEYEFGIANLGSFDTNGTHWVYKGDKIIFYFDFYGRQIDKKIRALVFYLEKNIFFNDNQIQDYNDLPICRHFCVYILNKLCKH